MVSRAGIERGDSQSTIDTKLRPFRADMTRAALQEFARICREAGVRPALMMLQIPSDDSARPARMTEIADFAASIRMDVLDLWGALDAPPRRSRTELYVAPWDYHTNAIGHRLLSDRFVQELRRVYGAASEPLVEPAR